MDIKILGTGCPNCKVLERTTREVVEEMGLQAQITKEEEIMKIMEYGVMRTPALVVDNKVVLSGRVSSRNEVKKLLTV